MDIQIDITQDFTIDKLRQLIASRNDDRDRQLRVSHDGIIYIEDNPHQHDLSDTYFAFGVWNEGEGYVGAAAAQDDDHIGRVFNAIQANWPKRKAPYKVVDTV
ncbi:hypothetical protein LG301_10710 [Vreelandella venusta]|uniref:hypothetical protein n=1 Tax=Vreelandella venusta TaxID=44935 RepID=UPI0038512D20